jgi:hypothetical protein
MSGKVGSIPARSILVGEVTVFVGPRFAPPMERSETSSRAARSASDWPAALVFSAMKSAGGATA